MVDVIKKGALLLMNQKCYDNYFLEYNFLDGEYDDLRLSLSKIS